MATTTVAAVFATAATHRPAVGRGTHDLHSDMTEMAAQTVGGSLGAMAALAAAWMLGHHLSSMSTMIWMAGGMGPMFGVSLVHWLRGRDTAR